MNQPRGPALFVSHHSSQLEVAEHVERALNAKGVRCWIAPRDVEPGASFARAIPDAIAESTAVLLLFSAASVKSPHVERELILADQLGKTIIPLRIEKVVDPGGLRYHLAAAQWIDWLEQRDAAIDRIAARAHGFAQAEPADAPPAPRDQAAPAPAFYPSHQPLPAAAPSPFPPPGPGPSGTGYGQPYPPPPPSAQAGGSGGNAIWIWMGLGVLGLVALVAVLLSLNSSRSDNSGPDVADSTRSFRAGNASAATGTSAADSARTYTAPDTGTADVITEEWFAGVWSDTRDCAEPYRFDLGGVLTTPTGDQGSWSIEDGNTLVVRGPGSEERRVIQRVSDDEVASSDGPGYRCFGSSDRD